MLDAELRHRTAEYRITISPANAASATRTMFLKGSAEVAPRTSGDLSFASSGSVSAGVEVGAVYPSTISISGLEGSAGDIRIEDDWTSPPAGGSDDGALASEELDESTTSASLTAVGVAVGTFVGVGVRDTVGVGVAV